MATENFLPTGALYRYLETMPTFPDDTTHGDHHNRPIPWQAFIPTNMYYVKADFGYYQPVLSALGNTVWCDLDEYGLVATGTGIRWAAPKSRASPM